MGKRKKWLEPTKNKVIVGIAALVLLVAVGFGNWSLTKPQAAHYELILKSSSPEIVMVEYGESVNEQTFSDLFELKRNGESVPDMSYYSFKNERVDSNKVTFNLTEEQLKIANSDKKDSLTFNDEQQKIIDEAAQYKVEVYEKETKLANAELIVVVIDTQAPVIEPIEDIETEVETPIEFTNRFKASDPVDGALEVKVEGEPDFSVAGTNELKAVAVDKNGNKTELAFNVIVKEKEVAQVQTESGNGNTSSNSNTASSNGGTSSGGSSGIGGVTSGGNTNSGGSTGSGTTTKPEEPSIPSRPDPYHVAKEIGMTFYKDYGNTDGCIAVSSDLAYKNQDTWINTYCDENGYLFYTPN